MILALISHRFGFTSHWSVGPVDKSPFGRRFSIHGFAQILSLQQRFSLSFAAIDISLHANYALILLNTNCTNYTNKVYHQYSVPTIFQVVTPISFLKNVIFGSSLQYRSALVVARMRNIVFILLLRGLPQGRCPSEAVCSKMELTSSNDSKSLLFLISKSFSCFKYLKDSLEILGGQSSKILSFHQFL